MKKTLLLLLHLQILFTVSAQELITNFENSATQTPNNLKYLGIVNSRVVFTAFTPENGNEIWVSDGTKSGTRLLKDINQGETSTYYQNFAVSNSWAYFTANDGIWKTDGTPENTYEIAKFNKETGEYFLKIAMLNEKVFVVSSIKSQTNFSWILPSDKIEKWEEKVQLYSLENNTLFYSKSVDSTYKVYQFNQRLKEIYTTKQQIIELKQFSSLNDIYCSVTSKTSNIIYEQHKVLIRIDKKEKEKNIILEWGNHPFIPLYVIDENENFYLIKSSAGKDSISLYSVRDKEFFLAKQMTGKKMNFMLGVSGTSSNQFYSNVILKNNQLFFVNGFYTVLTRVSQCHYFDFEKGIYRQTTVNLNDDFEPMNVYSMNDSIYRVDVRDYYFLYNSLLNIMVEKKQKAFLLKRTFFELNKQKYEFSDNIYLLNESTREPILSSREIYTSNSNYKLLNFHINGKQCLLFGNFAQSKHELWAIDSLNNSKLIAINKGGRLQGEPFRVKGISDKVFYVFVDSLRHNIYQTDGTVEGTSLAYSFKNSSNNLITYFLYNNNQIILQFPEKNIIISKDRIIEIKKDDGYFINTSEKFYLVKDYRTDKYFYEVVDSTALKFILSVNSINFAFTFQNRYYFLTPDKKLHYLDENNQVVTIAQNVDYVYRNGAYLYCRIYKGHNYYYHNTIDLQNNQVVLTAEWLNDINYNIEDDKIVYILKASNGIATKAFIFDGIKTHEALIPFNSRINQFKLFKNGFFIQYTSTTNQNVLVYYDFAKKDFVNVFSSTESFLYSFNQKADFILIESIGSAQKAYHIWSYKSRILKLLNFNDQLNLYVGNYATSSVGIWSFQNDELVRQEPTPKKIDEVRLDDILTYGTRFLPETGNELFAIGNNFSITFPEIIKGLEGIVLGNTFVFNNKLYAYVFTHSYGWQVWYMGEGRESEKSLNEENTVSEEDDVILFPNPVENLLFLNSSTPSHYQIINNTGQVVREGELKPQQAINFENLSEGLYIIQFFDGEKIFSKKVIKN